MLFRSIKGDNGWYRGEAVTLGGEKIVGVSLENARDNASGVAGYYYYIPTESEIANGIIPEINQMLGENKEVGGNPMNIKQNLAITEDGIKTVIVRLVDKAGNISGPSTIQVKVDNTPPIISLAEVKDDYIAGDGFMVTTLATDEPRDAEGNQLSEITYSYYVQEVGTGGRRLVKETKESNCIVGGLKAETTYIVFVEARDDAGNIAKANEGAGLTITTKEEGTSVKDWGGNGRRK